MHRRNYLYRFDSVIFSASAILSAMLLVSLSLPHCISVSAAASTSQLLTGRVLAGETPIKHATVTLFATVMHNQPIFAHTSSEPVGESHTDQEGRFSFDLAKAHAELMAPLRMGGPLLRIEPPPIPGTFYLVASGGDAGGGDNPAITLVSALGSPPPEGRVTINELTTVVAAFSVGYVSTAAWFSDKNLWERTAVFPMAVFPDRHQTSVTPGGDKLTTTGSTPGDWSLALTNQLIDPVEGRLRPVFFRGVNSPELVNTLADVLHSCVVSPGPGFAKCSSLLQAATLPSPWNLRPQNTLTAIESIVSKLGRTNSAVMRLLPSQRPYTPALAQAPNGWLLSLNFTGLGLHRPTAIREDSTNRTLWILNSGNQTLTELSTEPNDFTKPLLGTREVPAAVRNDPVDFWFARSYEGFFQSAPRPKKPGWFSKESVWITHGQLVFLRADGTACASPLSAAEVKRARGLSGSTIWGEKVFVANTGADEMLIFKQQKHLCGGGELADRLKPPFGSAAPKSFLVKPSQVVACPNFVNVWFTNPGVSSVGAFYYGVCLQALPGTPFRGAGLSDPKGIDCDNDRDVWIANHDDAAKSVSELDTPADPSTPITPSPCLDRKGLGGLYRMKVEALSPSSGFLGTGLNRPYGVAVDQFGNVWVTNEGNDSLTVFIGAGGVPAGGRMLTGG